MQLNLSRNVNNKKKDFCKHIGDKNKTKEGVGSLLNETEDLTIQDMEKSDVQTFFASDVTNKTDLQESQVPDTTWKG